jgi:hypothetical protein
MHDHHGQYPLVAWGARGFARPQSLTTAEGGNAEVIGEIARIPCETFARRW